MDQTKVMPERDGEDDLEAAVERFAKWRQARQRGEHIPTELWASAVSLSTRQGTHRVAEALGLNADRLLRRVRDSDGQALPTKAAEPEPDSAADFVQLLVASSGVEAGAAPAPTQAPAAAQPCVLELRNARDATLRMELPAQALAILPGLCAAFGGACRRDTALDRYLVQRTLPTTPRLWNPTKPLLRSLELDSAGGITAARLWAVMKRIFAQVADIVQEQSPATAEKLRRASPHWMRHTHATHALERGVDLATVRDNLRHASVSDHIGVPSRRSGKARPTARGPLRGKGP